MTAQRAWMGFKPRRATASAFAATTTAAMHRLQHCRQPELADQLDADHSVIALEEEAMALQNRGKQDPLAAASWVRRKLREHCIGDPKD